MFSSAPLRGSRLVCVLLILVAIARIVATYPVLNHTMDEPTHISSGLQWWQEHRYTYEILHPPLGRIAAAAGPYLLGAKNVASHEVSTKSPLVLYEAPSYWTMLSAARAGELPFFILAAFIVWLWARRLHGNAAAVCALFLFTLLPPVLAHAGLATTDIPLCATVVAAAYAFFLFLEKPDLKRGLLLGLATGAALLAKYTALIFLPACFATVYLLRLRRGMPRPAVKPIAAAAVVALMFLWAGYNFSVAAVPVTNAVYMLPLPEAVKRMSIGQPDIVLPAAEFTRGIIEARSYSQVGDWSYLLGELSNRGWWYFFPVVFAIKTPLAFIMLAIVGCYALRRCPREQWIPGACALAILLVVLPARINLGVRHILPVFPLLSIPAGYALASMAASATRTSRYLALVLALWAVGASLSAHPDYIGYFNEIASGEPERFRVDADLDWGQNMKRLGDWIREKGIRDPIALVYYGATDPSRHGIRGVAASPWKPSTGWIAASTTPLMMSREKAPDGSNRRPWWWLDGLTPVDSVGGILIFHVPRADSNPSLTSPAP